MPVNLNPADFATLSRVLKTSLRLLDIRGRVNFLETMLLGSPPERVQILINSIDFSGPAEVVATEMVLRLRDYGEVAFGQEALSVLLNNLEGRVGESDAAFLRGLFVRYPLKGESAVDQPAPSNSNWRDVGSTAKMVEEKIIGENTMEDIRVLVLAFEASKSVAQIALPGESAGTGFLIAPDLILTNNHVVASIEKARRVIIRFNFQFDCEGKLGPVKETTMAERGLFHTNSDRTLRDYTVFQIKPLAGYQTPLKLNSDIMEIGDRVAIIQHPGGLEKKIAMRDNYVAYADNFVLQYYTATERGSSGAPCFNKNYEVVALHHAGGMLAEPGTLRRYFRNEGITLREILKDLQEHAPKIKAKIPE